MSIDLTTTMIHRFPHSFINKCADPILVTPLSENRRGELLEMYLAFTRNTFSGLPLIQGRRCT